MKFLSKLPFVTALCTGLGLLCLCIRQWMFRTGVDDKGLLIIGHPGLLISWALLAVTVAVLFLSLRERQVFRFSSTPLSITGTVFFTIGYGYASWQLLSSRAQVLSLVAGILGILSCLCALLAIILHCSKRHVHPFVYCPAVLFFLFFLVCRYQQWSGEPELQRYLFQTLCVIFLMLSAYHRAALAADRKGARIYLLFSRAAIFFCISAIPGSQYGVLYGCSAVALILDGFSVSKSQGA